MSLYLLPVLMLVAIMPALTRAAEWVHVPTQRKSATYVAGWLPITQYAPLVSNGYTRVRLWVNTTNDVDAFEVWEDARLMPTAFTAGIHIPPGGWLVIDDAETGAGYVLARDDDGVPFFVGPVHGSPWRTRAEIDGMIVDAKATRRAAKANRAAAKVAADDAIRGASPQVRGALQSLSARIDALETP